MRKMGFSETQIGWVMQCVTTVSYSILVNGVPVGNIQPSRGIWQSDPLSPYLFIFCAEVLSAQFHHAESTHLIGGVLTSLRGMRINHLFFADDSLLFCKATTQE
jgi:hypothetical protein